MTQRKKEIFHSISPFFYSPFNEKDAQIDLFRSTQRFDWNQSFITFGV